MGEDVEQFLKWWSTGATLVVCIAAFQIIFKRGKLSVKKTQKSKQSIPTKTLR